MKTMAQSGAKPTTAKNCFVTIGATASFDSLIEAVMSLPVLAALTSAGYTELLVQYGKDGRGLFLRLVSSAHQQNDGGDDGDDGFPTFRGFDFDANGVMRYMRDARDSGGCVISHAGSGSILDALRINAPLIVVPNPELLDNHQDELAEALAGQGYVVHGTLSELAPAIEQVAALAKRRKEWPPVNSGVHRQARGLQGIVDEELGYLD